MNIKYRLTVSMRLADGTDRRMILPQEWASLMWQMNSSSSLGRFARPYGAVEAKVTYKGNVLAHWITEAGERLRRNPVRVSFKQKSIRSKNPHGRVHLSGRRYKARGEARTALRSRGRLKRRDPRKLKCLVRRAGWRVNPGVKATRSLANAQARAYRKNPKKRRFKSYGDVKAVVTTLAGKHVADFYTQKEAIAFAKSYAKKHRIGLRVVDPR